MRKVVVPQKASTVDIGDTRTVRAEIVPLGTIYRSPKFAEIHRDGLGQYDPVLRTFGMSGLMRPENDCEGKCVSPFTCLGTEYRGPWKQDKNKRTMHVLLDAKTRKTLVAKGVGTFDAGAEERDGKSPMPIQVSRWFLQPYMSISYGRTFSYASASFNAAIAYKAECAKYGRKANTLDPIAVVKLETIPLQVKKDFFIEVPVEKCFEWQLEGVSKEDRLVYGKELRGMGASNREARMFFESIRPVSPRVAERFYSFMAGETGLGHRADILRAWRPVVSIYVAESANVRVGSATTGQILEENGIGAGGKEDTPERMAALAKEFAGKLAQSAFFHSAGGDFGGVDGELDMRNVSVRCAIMDLDACTLPGGRPNLKKQGEDRTAARETVGAFCRKIGMFPPEVDEMVGFFDSEYGRNLNLRPTKA